MGGGGNAKNGFKGEPGKKILSVKEGGGEGHQKNSFKFCSDGICDNRDLKI